MKRQPTTQQITWFLDLSRNSQLDLDPPYQRKSVWTLKDRKFFLDTIFRNYPAPPVFIHRTVNDNGYTTYHVVDGKQRLETILSFFDNKIAIAADFGDTNLNGKKFKELSQDYKRKFWDYTLVVDFIDSVNGTNIEEVFDRVNRNSRNLQPQELRHAKFNGWFINYVEEESDTDFWWQFKISTRERDKRMKNVQFISELLMVLLNQKIIGFDQSEIDKTYAAYDDIEELTESGLFNLEEFTTKIDELKNFIMDANNHNNNVIKFIGGSNNNFYTLFSYIVLNKPTDPQLFADSYVDFMNLVSTVKDKLDQSQEVDADALKYFNNSKGASTDLFQRNERLNALVNSI